MHENECGNAESVVIPLRACADNVGPFEALMKAAKGIKNVECGTPLNQQVKFGFRNLADENHGRLGFLCEIETKNPTHCSCKALVQLQGLAATH